MMEFVVILSTLAMDVFLLMLLKERCEVGNTMDEFVERLKGFDNGEDDKAKGK